MKEIVVQSEDHSIKKQAIDEALKASLADDIGRYKKVLLIPPDMTRLHSGAGDITASLYQMLKDTCQVDILPALGTHDPMTEKEIQRFFGGEIPGSCFIRHNWREDVVKLGEAPSEFVAELSEGRLNDTIDVMLNKNILDKSYDQVISIGQVVPHEVAGMANFNKNLLVGCGGPGFINGSHMLGAVYGMERIMGRDHTPVRKLFDYAEGHYFGDIPLTYILTVTTESKGKVHIHGLYIGRERRIFEQAVAMSQKKNLTQMPRPIKKAVVYLDEAEFRSTWLGNKAIYRTRMAIADGGSLIILAPGVEKFGEDPTIDRLIRKYGYVNRDQVLEMFRMNEDLKENMSVAAHLIHGSPDGRFSVTYAVKKLSKREVESVGFKYMDFDEAEKRYRPDQLADGFNILPDGEEIFFISNPALGLWMYEQG